MKNYYLDRAEEKKKAVEGPFCIRMNDKFEFPHGAKWMQGVFIVPVKGGWGIFGRQSDYDDFLKKYPDMKADSDI